MKFLKPTTPSVIQAEEMGNNKKRLKNIQVKTCGKQNGRLTEYKHKLTIEIHQSQLVISIFVQRV